MPRVCGQEPECEQVVRLAAAHRLGQLEHPLRGLPLQSPEPLGKKGLHSLRDVVLGEELVRVDTAVNQIGQIEHRVPTLGIEGAGTGDTRLLQDLHGDKSCPVTGCGTETDMARECGATLHEMQA